MGAAPRADGLDPADVYSTALERWLASGAADLDDRLPQVLAELGLGDGAGASSGSAAEGAVGPDSR